MNQEREWIDSDIEELTPIVPPNHKFSFTALFKSHKPSFDSFCDSTIELKGGLDVIELDTVPAELLDLFK